MHLCSYIIISSRPFLFYWNRLNQREMVLHFLHIAKRGIFDLVKMRESNLALSVEKK